MTVETGQMAPDFALYDGDDNLVKLSEMKGAPVTAMFVCKTCQKRALKQVADGVDPFV